MTTRGWSSWFGVGLLALLLSGCGSSGGGPGDSAAGPGRILPADQATDTLTIAFASDPDPLQAGDNDLEVTVTGADGSPITDATVTLVFSMPAMPSMNMPAMRTDASLEHQGAGTYRGTGRLSMGGTWNVALSVTRNAEQAGRRRFSIVARE